PGGGIAGGPCPGATLDGYRIAAAGRREAIIASREGVNAGGGGRGALTRALGGSAGAAVGRDGVAVLCARAQACVLITGGCGGREQNTGAINIVTGRTARSVPTQINLAGGNRR